MIKLLDDYNETDEVEQAIDDNSYLNKSNNLNFMKYFLKHRGRIVLF